MCQEKRKGKTVSLRIEFTAKDEQGTSEALVTFVLPANIRTAVVQAVLDATADNDAFEEKMEGLGVELNNHLASVYPGAINGEVAKEEISVALRDFVEGALKGVERTLMATYGLSIKVRAGDL